MVKDAKLLEEFKREYLRKTPVDIQQNLKLADSLYEIARFFKVIPRENPLENIEHTIALAQALNGIKPDRKNRRRARKTRD